VPYLLMAKKCQHIVSDTQRKMYDQTSKMLKEETDAVFYDAVGIPANWADIFDGVDVYPLMMVMAGLLAPLQLSLTWV